MLSLKTLPLVLEKLRKSRGVYTDEQIDRCCQIGGQFGAALESLFSCNVGSERTVHSRHSTRDITHDVHVFLKNYVSDKLWRFQSGSTMVLRKYDMSGRLRTVKS